MDSETGSKLKSRRTSRNCDDTNCTRTSCWGVTALTAHGAVSRYDFSGGQFCYLYILFDSLTLFQGVCPGDKWACVQRFTCRNVCMYQNALMFNQRHWLCIWFTHTVWLDSPSPKHLLLRPQEDSSAVALCKYHVQWFRFRSVHLHICYITHQMLRVVFSG